MKRFTLLFMIMATALLAVACAPSADQPEGEPLSAAAEQGKLIFDSRCLRCHAVDGAGGKKGPDLSHISSSRDVDWLTRFMTNPQAVDPDNKMPQVFLRPEELSAVVEYMKALD